MAYLFRGDYAKLIQARNLDDISGNDSRNIAMAEAAAVEQARSYLVQRYDLKSEFRDILVWDESKTYSQGDRVYLDALAYNTGTTYGVKSLALYQGGVYRCKTANTTGAWDGSKWDLLGLQYDIFFAAFPYPEFDFNTYYPVGQQVFWRGKNYTCRVASYPLSHSSKLQYDSIEALPYLNTAPDDPVRGSYYWGSGTPYSVPANTVVTNTTYWTPGDNRSQQLVTVVVDIALYHLHSRIAPQNIPELRKDRYDNALTWLKQISRAELNAKMPEIKPAQGSNIRYGGEVKRNNEY